MQSICLSSNTSIEIVLSDNISTGPSAMTMDLMIIREPIMKINGALESKSGVNKFGYVKFKYVIKLQDFQVFVEGFRGG